ncbi:MAG: hypothetical protein WCF85_22535 [Rhodospirillaceae bacterium]
MKNDPHPARMTTTDRLDEVAHILAAGILRARARRPERQVQKQNENREVSLDMTPKESGHVRTETGRGEKR